MSGTGTTSSTRQLAEGRVGTPLAGKWMLDSLLGYGGSAAVYAATHRNGKRAAIKILHPHCVADEQLRTRFVREGYVANKIGHPGAVSVLDDDIADGTPYLVMELLEGTSLERRGRGDSPPMTLAEVIRIGDDLLDVLAKAHDVGCVHRDIKPANLFVTHEGQLKVLDFGIARLTAGPGAIEGGTTQTGLMMGTPAFMPPEQARARWSEVDGRSDLWAVGATMIALLLGRRPRIAETANEELLLAMTVAMPPLSVLVPNAPTALGVVIDKAVAFNREDRFPNARAMQEALRAAASGIETSSMAMTLVERAPAPPPSQTTTEHVVNHANATLVTPSPRLRSVTGPQAFGGGFPADNSHNSHNHNNNNNTAVTPPLYVPPTPVASDLDLEPPQSLTTSRAVLQSAPPPNARAPKKPSSAPALIAIAALLAIGSIGGVGLYMRRAATHAAAAAGAAPPTATTTATTTTTTTTATASADPPPVAEDPNTVAAALPAPPPTQPGGPLPPSKHNNTTTNKGPTTTVTPTTTPAKPQASSSSNPAKYFDTRF